MICQYFLQGRCRFGQNCRYEHSYSSNDDKNNRPSISTQQLNDVIKLIVADVIVAEKGGQWPLSCYAPVKEGVNIPGWEDISPEEVRWKMYEGRANGTLNQCINEVNELYSNAEKRRNALKQPTIERINLIVNVLKGKKEQHGASNPFITSSEDNKSKFQLDSHSTNIFGSVTQSTTSQSNIFGGATKPVNHGNIFRDSGQLVASQGSIFGGTPQVPNYQGSIFGGSSPSFSNQNAFATSNYSNTVATTATTAPTTNFFNNTQSANQNLFSNSANINTTVASGSGSIFSSQNVFSQNNEIKSLFPIENSKNVNNFQNQNYFTKSSDMFSSQSSNKNNFENSTSTFTNIIASNQPNLMDTSVYSKTEELSEEELKAFSAPTFALRKIPLKPPPLSLC